MVDLSQVKMPVVEYEDGTREPVFEYDPEDEDGEIRINGAYYNPDGSPASRGCLRIVAIHPAEPAADGWVRTEHVAFKQFGNYTCLVTDKGVDWFIAAGLTTMSPPWWTIHDSDEEKVDAAYARHLEPKPVLVWDDRFEFLSSATHDESFYQVNRRRSGTWFAGVFNSDGYQNIGANTFEKLEAAKQACERHARGK